MNDKKPCIWAVVLASGLSTRMGIPKLLLPLRNKTIISPIIDQALVSELDGISVVINANVEGLYQEVSKYPVNRIILNQEPHNGMSVSLRKGLESIPCNVNAVMFLLGDQPEITHIEINKMMHQYNQNNNVGIYQAIYFGEKGHPVLFDRSIFPHLLNIEGDIGARNILKQFQEQVEYVEMGRTQIHDIDTIEDYRKLIGRQNR